MTDRRFLPSIRRSGSLFHAFRAYPGGPHSKSTLAVSGFMSKIHLLRGMPSQRNLLLRPPLPIPVIQFDIPISLSVWTELARTSWSITACLDQGNSFGRKIYVQTEEMVLTW